MMLTAGTRLGIYEIIDALGAGGMGEVYRARDTRLRREVAIKILPERVAADADRTARFQREAELLAALNHPNIAAIYGVEDSTGATAIVMELVAGETLADIIARGALPVDEALAIARQIADALEAAHERGVIHRDLKPANIKLTPEGKVKVLDFGLAKVLEGGASERTSGGLTMSPTLSVHATYAGIILGTAAYMSPEQARGKPVERRADIWAFGCVLYEMLTGRQTFAVGETVSDAVAAVLKSDVDWRALPASTPPHVVRLLRRCLQKDPQKRLPHIGLVRLELDDPPETAPPAARSRTPTVWRRAWPFAGVALAVAAIATAAVMAWRSAAPVPVVRFAIALPAGQDFSTPVRAAIAISPDGTQIVYEANHKLFRRGLSDAEAMPVPGTDVGPNALVNPVFSPDGRSVAFIVGRTRAIKRVAIEGGVPVTVCVLDAAITPYGLTWDDSGLLFAHPERGLMRVSPGGGVPELLMASEPGEVMHAPVMVPGTRSLLFASARGADVEGNARKFQISAYSLDTRKRTRVIDSGTDVRYLNAGYLVYAANGTIFGIRFDPRTMSVAGAPAPLVEGVRDDFGLAHYVVSATGSLAYIPGRVLGDVGQSDIALFDRKANVERLNLPVGRYEAPRVSPDGRSIVFGIDDGRERSIAIYPIAGGASIRRLTFGGNSRFPVWAPDGRRIVYQADREGRRGLFLQDADGGRPAEQLTRPDGISGHIPDSWSRDGKYLLFTDAAGPSQMSLWVLSLDDRKVQRFEGVESAYPINASFSPDGRWVAYQSSVVTGNSQIFVRPFPPNSAKYQVTQTVTSSHHAVWSLQGRELVLTPGRNLFGTISIATQPVLTYSTIAPLPKPGFYDPGPWGVRSFDVLSDGRIVAPLPLTDGLPGEGPPHVNVVLNWIDEVKQRVSAR